MTSSYLSTYLGHAIVVKIGAYLIELWCQHVGYWKRKKDLVGTYRSFKYFGIGKWGGTLASYTIKSRHHDKDENLLNLRWRKHAINHTICLPDVYLANVNGCQRNLANALLDWNTFFLNTLVLFTLERF